MKNQTGKYLKYAIGEIVLVMIGILLALQVNNWNQNRVNNNKEHRFLIGLKQDLENQIKFLEANDNFSSLIKNKGELILDEYSKKGMLLAIDSINRKLSFMMYTLGYNEVNTTFSELKTTGQLHLIKNDSLRSKIIKFYQYSDVTMTRVNSNISNVYYNHIFPIIKSSVIINFENFGYDSNTVDSNLLRKSLKTPFEKNLSNPAKEFDIINAISLRTIVADNTQESVKKVLEIAETLLEDLNIELKHKNND